MRAVLRSRTVSTMAYGVLALGWSNAASLLAVPIYIRVLGREEWGLAAACVLLQTIASFLDAGLSQIVPREISVANHDRACMRHLLAYLRKRYLVAASILLISVEIVSGLLAENWFQASQEEQHRLTIALRISATQVFFQFMNSMNMGIWFGLERHRTANLRSTFFIVARHSTAIICIVLWNPSVIVYCSSLAVVAGVEFIANTISIQKLVKSRFEACCCGEGGGSGATKRSAFGAGLLLLTAGTIVGLAVSQSDKVAMSRFASLSDYGVYSAVAAIAASLLALQAPVSRVFLPRLVGDFRAHGWPTRGVLMKFGVSMALIAVAPAIVAAMFADQILRLFFVDVGSIALGVSVLQLQAVGVALSAPLACLYLVMLANGQYRPMLALNAVALISLIVLVMIFPDRSDIRMGGAMYIVAAVIRVIGASAWFGAQSQRVTSKAQ
jgi:O-antigen/teichoic acid export membrane protein